MKCTFYQIERSLKQNNEIITFQSVKQRDKRHEPLMLKIIHLDWHTYKKNFFFVKVHFIMSKLVYHNAVPKKERVQPVYIGFSQTLKGNPVTRESFKIPK